MILPKLSSCCKESLLRRTLVLLQPAYLLPRLRKFLWRHLCTSRRPRRKSCFTCYVYAFSFITAHCQNSMSNPRLWQNRCLKRVISLALCHWATSLLIFLFPYFRSICIFFVFFFVLAVRPWESAHSFLIAEAARAFPLNSCCAVVASA